MKEKLRFALGSVAVMVMAVCLVGAALVGWLRTLAGAVTRTAALAFKLAEREIHKNAVGEYPVLLLDDVLSELDERRQEYVLNRIAGGQLFITCCENDRLDTLQGGRVFHIRDGEVL